MPCTVHAYNTSLTPVTTSTVKFIAQNFSTGTNLCAAQTNSNISGSNWGATLPFSTQAVAYLVYAYDTVRVNGYGPVTITNLNGNINGRLDIVMYRLPPPHSGIGAQPKTFTEIAAYVNAQSWEDEEKLGIMFLIQALATSHRTRDADLRQIRDKWASWLSDLGIDPALI